MRAREILVEQWREHRSPALADLIDVIDPVTVEVTPRVASTLANVKAIADLDDPRYSKWALDQLVALPFTAKTANDLLRELVKIVEARRDLRIRDYENRIWHELRTRIGPLQMRMRLIDRVRRVAKNIPEVEELDVSELAKLVEPLRRTTRTAASLLADIYANPTDDAPRIVYADLLSEQGDPRGEFITLQIERDRSGLGTPSEREVALLKKHGKAWLGPLAPVLSWGRGYSRTVFRRGFPAVADIILSYGKKLEPIRAEPAWATIEEFDGMFPLEIAETAPFTALHTIEQALAVEGIRTLARRKVPLNVTTIRLDDVTVTGEMLRRALPKLDTLLIYALTWRAIPIDNLGSFGVRRVTLTHNWFAPGEIDAGRAGHAELLAKLVGKAAFLDRLEICVPYVASTNTHTYDTLVRGPDGTFVLASK